MIKKIFLIFSFLYVISYCIINAEETYLTPGKLIFSQGGYLQSYPGTIPAGKSNLDGYLKIGNDKGIEFAGSILEISTQKPAPLSLSQSFETSLHNGSTVPTYLFSGSKLSKFVLMENKDSKFGFSAYSGSTSSGFTPSMLYIQKKNDPGIYNTVLTVSTNKVYILRFPAEIRVGIGTSMPQSTLDIAGHLKISGGGLSLPSDTMAASVEAERNTGGSNSSLYLCPTSITINDVYFNVIFFVTCRIKTIGGRPNFKVYVTGTRKDGTSFSSVESPRVYPGWVGYNSNHPYTVNLGTYYRDAATIGLSWSTKLAPGTYTAYVIVNGEGYSPNFEVKLSYIKMMEGITGLPAPPQNEPLPAQQNTNSIDLTNSNLSGTFFTSNTLVLTPDGYSMNDEYDATSVLQNSKAGLILRSKKGLRDLRVSKVKVYDKAPKYDLLVVKDHPQSGTATYATSFVNGSTPGPVGFTAYPAYIKNQYDTFNNGQSTFETPKIDSLGTNEVSATIGYTGDFYFKNKVNISDAIIANTYGVHISNGPVEPINTSPMLNVNGNIIVRGTLMAKVGFIQYKEMDVESLFFDTMRKSMPTLNINVPALGANTKVKVMVSAILPFKLHESTKIYNSTHFAVKITLYLNSIPIGSGYIGQSKHIQYKGFSRLYTLQINGIVDNLETGRSYPIEIEYYPVTGPYGNGYNFAASMVSLYLLADEFNKANITYIGTVL